MEYTANTLDWNSERFEFTLMSLSTINELLIFFTRIGTLSLNSPQEVCSYYTQYIDLFQLSFILHWIFRRRFEKECKNKYACRFWRVEKITFCRGHQRGEHMGKTGPAIRKVGLRIVKPRETGRNAGIIPGSERMSTHYNFSITRSVVTTIMKTSAPRLREPWSFAPVSGVKRKRKKKKPIQIIWNVAPVSDWTTAFAGFPSKRSRPVKTNTASRFQKFSKFQGL